MQFITNDLLKQGMYDVTAKSGKTDFKLCLSPAGKRTPRTVENLCRGFCSRVMYSLLGNSNIIRTFRKFLFVCLIGLLWIGCASAGVKDASNASPYTVQKNGELTAIKKIASMNPYNKTTKAFTQPTDTPVLLFGSTISARVDEIYSSSIDGGDAILNLAKKLKLDKKFDSALQEVVAYTDGTPLSEDTKETLFTIGSKGKIDAIAFPIISGGFDQLKNGEKIQMYLVVFEIAKKDVQYIAVGKDVSLTEADMQAIAQNPSQGLAAANTTIIKKTNEFADSVQKEIKGTSATPATDTVANETAKKEQPSVEPSETKSDTEDKPKEEEKELTMFDKLLGPSLFGTVVALWLLLP